MRYFTRMAFLAVLVLGGAAGGAAAEVRGRPDGCLTTLYNYPAEAPPGGVSARVPSESLLTRGVRPPAGLPAGNVPSRTRVRPPRRTPQ